MTDQPDTTTPIPKPDPTYVDDLSAALLLVPICAPLGLSLVHFLTYPSLAPLTTAIVDVRVKIGKDVHEWTGIATARSAIKAFHEALADGFDGRPCPSCGRTMLTIVDDSSAAAATDTAGVIGQVCAMDLRSLNANGMVDFEHAAEWLTARHIGMHLVTMAPVKVSNTLRFDRATGVVETS